MDIEKSCSNCIWRDNPVPNLEPCSSWETCLLNNHCDFKPTFAYRFLQRIKNVFRRT